MKTSLGCTVSRVLCLSTVMLLAGCGGGDDGGSAVPAASSTGNFVDSPVRGLSYSGSNFSGVTGPNGEFQYTPGEPINFSIGSLSIGGALAGPMMTPFSLLNNTMVPGTGNEGSVSLARLLLTLNTTPGTATITLPSPLPVLPSSVYWWDSSLFETAMQNVGITPISRSEAVAHLKAQFAIWGSWTTTGTAAEVRVLTFLPNGTFFLADDDDPLVPGGADGMERGTYRWNATTNELTYATQVNTDGTGGLSNLTPGPYTFVIDPSGNAAVLRFGPNVNDTIAFTRVIDQNNPIVGAWSVSPPMMDGPGAILTLLADGSFTVASDAADTDPAGMERGTYTYDGTHLALTTTVDPNGQFGANDSPTLPAVETIQANVYFLLGSRLLQVIVQNNSTSFFGVEVP